MATSAVTDSGGLSGFVNALQNGAKDEDVAVPIIGSVEYYVKVSVVLDTVPPILTVTAPLAKGNHSGTARLIGTGVDSGSGLATVSYAIDGGA